MRLVGARDLIFAAKPTEDGKVLVRIGHHRFTASRTEAVQLATEIVAAVDALPGRKHTMTDNPTDINDDQLAGRVQALLTHAVENLDPADRAERISWCQQNDQHGIRMHLSEDDELLEFRWGNRPLAMIRRQDLLGDTPVRVEYIDTDIPDTLEGLSDEVQRQQTSAPEGRHPGG